MVEKSNMIFKRQEKYNFHSDNLSYLKDKTILVWLNRYEMKCKKPISFTEFSVSIFPEVGSDYKGLKEDIFKECDFGSLTSGKIYLFTGDAVFIFLKDNNTLLNSIYTDEVNYRKNRSKYTVTLINTKKSFDLSQYKEINKPVQKMLYKLIISLILKCNPNLETYRNMFYIMTDKKELSSGNKEKILLYPGFTKSISLTNERIFLNITTKYNIISTKTCLELINSFNKNKEAIENALIGMIVKSGNHNYQVESVCFDKNPTNTYITYGGNEKVNLVTYNLKKYGKKITDKEQCLLKAKIKSGFTVDLIPEFCVLTGLNDSMIKDNTLMRNISKYNLGVEGKVKYIQDTLLHFSNSNRKEIKNREGKVIKTLPSAKELASELGVELQAKETIINGYLMNEPRFVSKNTTLLLKDIKRKPVYENMINQKKNENKRILITYHYDIYEETKDLESLFNNAGKAYDFKMPEFDWNEIDTYNPDDWINSTLKKLKEEDFLITIFILTNQNDFLYNKLKHSSLSFEGQGYLSQVVYRDTLFRKNSLSVASNILLQINNKLGGSQYVLNLNNSEYAKKDLLLIGVDSSHMKGRRTGVAFLATINKEFNKYYSEEIIIDEENKKQIDYSMLGKFVNKAIKEYSQLNGKLPKGIVIYRVGVSEEQKEYLSNEVENLDIFCKGMHSDSVNKNVEIPYYYILVNKKSTIKFFQKVNKKNYENPESGLIILDGATDSSKFEFFIQPQKVTQGTATPTQYHVAYGTLKLEEIIPKLTYDLCFVYPNWTGPVRVPHVLKLAEKLAKMVAKNIGTKLHESLKYNPSFL